MQVRSTIGQYRLLRKIGEGGMGVVFVGEHVLIQRKAAIKVLKPEMSNGRRSLERFFNEARATAAIQDPGIVQLFDVGMTRDGSAYIVMELLDGESLDVRLQRLGRSAPVDALRVVRQVAGTLAIVHAAGIVHRDLKPANLFGVVDATAPGGERIKILDFGVAKLGPGLHDGAPTHAGSLLGTPIYMSPEQCSGHAVDPRADIYSLGCVLFRLVTGRPPFAVEGVGPLIAAHLSEPPPPPSRFVSELPAGFDELVLRCLAKSRADRFPTMTDLAEDCDRLLGAAAQREATTPHVPDVSTVVADPSIAPDTAASEPRSLVGPRRIRWIGATVIGVIVGSVVAVAVSGIGGARTTVAPRSAAPRQAIVGEPALRPAAANPPAANLPVANPPAANLPVANPPAANPPAAKPPVANPPVPKPAVMKSHPTPRAAVRRNDPYEDRN